MQEQCEDLLLMQSFLSLGYNTTCILKLPTDSRVFVGFATDVVALNKLATRSQVHSELATSPAGMCEFATDARAAWELATSAVVVRKWATAILDCANTVADTNPWRISYKHEVILLITYRPSCIWQVTY